MSSMCESRCNDLRLASWRRSPQLEKCGRRPRLLTPDCLLELVWSLPVIWWPAVQIKNRQTTPLEIGRSKGSGIPCTDCFWWLLVILYFPVRSAYGVRYEEPQREDHDGD